MVTLMILQVVAALGLLNVWLLRSRSATAYRGGDAMSLKDEFAVYGLPPWMLYVVGFLKVGAAVALLAGVWMSSAVLPAAAIVAVLMVGALAMHMKVKDAPIKSMPAALMLAMNVCIVAFSVS